MRVSIVIPTRNRPRFLREALLSMRRQTEPALEAVVVNDGGADVAEVVRGSELPSQYVHLDRSHGQPAALNRGVRASRGELVALCDDDDVFGPDHLAGVAAGMAATPGCEFAYGDVYAFSESPDQPIGFLGDDFQRERLFETNYTATNSWVFTRALYDRLGGFDESLPMYWDWDFVLRASAVTQVAHIRGAASFYRVHPESIQLTTPLDARRGQLDLLCEKHGLGRLPLKTLFDNFTRL